MSYTNQDKKDFILKDIKYAIGQGMGNAFSKAVDVIINSGKSRTEDEVVNAVFELRDKFFISNQEAIAEAYAKWLKENEDGLDMTLGLGTKDSPEPL